MARGAGGVEELPQQAELGSPEVKSGRGARVGGVGRSGERRWANVVDCCDYKPGSVVEHCAGPWRSGRAG